MGDINTMKVLWTIGLLFSLASSSSANTVAQKIEVHSRRSAMLPCFAPEGTDTEDIALEWTRPGLEPLYMFLFRDGRPYLAYQDSHFKDRVLLANPGLQNGDLSVVLNDVGVEDEGRYECHIFSQSQRRKRSVFDTEPITVVHLKVLEPEPQTIQAFAGQDVVLPFKPLDISVTGLMWKRPDLCQEQFVYVYGMGHPHHQLPQYEGRVQLLSQSPAQTRDLSVVLKNVQPSDSGLYQCHIIQSQRRKRDTHQSEPYRVINILVSSAGVRSEPVFGAALLALLLMFSG